MNRVAAVGALVGAVVCFGGLAGLAGSASAAEPAVDLIGTWHVLVHYRDEHAHDPKALRWDDRIWVFERSGSRLRWTEYPLVVFRDQTGRFEQSGTSRAARVLHAWEPNAKQRAQIESGVEVNSRGQQSKLLQRGDDEGWQSTSRSAAASASIVSYVQHWSIRDPGRRPTFRREDTLGSARTESIDGVTEYATTEVENSGDVLRGTFERDGTRHGTFRMTRAGTARGVEGRVKSDGQRFHDAYLDELRSALERRESALRDAAESGSAGGDAALARAVAEVRAALVESVREAGGDPSELKPEIDSLSVKIARRMLYSDRSPADIEKMLKDGRINP